MEFGAFIVNLDISYSRISQINADTIIQNMYIISPSINSDGILTIQDQYNNNNQLISLNINNTSNWSGLVSKGWTIN